MTDISANKERFLKIINSYVHREGIGGLLNSLAKSDFYEAPASTQFHSNFKGGLVLHQLNVYSDLWDQISLRAFLAGLPIYQEVDKLKNGEILDLNEEYNVSKFLDTYFGKSKVTIESIAICGLLHDCHKINFYEMYEKSIYLGLDENGNKKFDHKRGYKLKEDQFVFGLEGTNSNYIIESKMALTFDEKIAIENHMGYIHGLGLMPSAGKAWSKHKLAALLHISDMNASYLLEEIEK